MTNDTRSPNEIERDIERERTELAGTVRALQEKFTPEAVISELTRNFREHGGDVGQAVTRSVKQNPVALALTGVGLAWLMFGRSYDPLAENSRINYGRRHDHDDLQSPPPADSSYVGSKGYRTGRELPSHRSPTVTERSASSRTYPDWAREYDRGAFDADNEGGRGIGDKASDLAGRGKAGVSSAAGSVAGGAKSAGAGVAGAARSAGGAVSGAASSAGSAASGAARSAADRAARARDALAHGTENLSEAARERVIAARERAMDMRDRAARTASDSWNYSRDSATDFIEEQPLVAGALALAVGAALGSALPRTRYEDEYLGRYRDDLFDEAERIFHEEREKAERVGKAALGEASKIVDEKRADMDETAPGSKSAAEAAADEAKSAGKRVADAAKDEADNQNLGKPKS
ncbi:hypothetical protein OG2516_03523 [Oceanicola granulosus HTCC2516]|uniref:DUF3618 domain-containing protein n=1 Tax=Oceanicola granulosus (strain ATCC BAA-861 / DSM 15982 / KCTC 12143 / HTCC2516) TaxID=314256 RepID=Q2CAI1_OCEGH|nr:DUF3618 domain-containing protein [Oceanicola granulosus]EAR49693.1 hypothetical protein OG2516_03523 [Oceanicola granulosus HTCC2516]